MYQLINNWPEAHLDPADMALCTYAAKLTRAPETMTEADVALLRQHRFGDRAIHDATQVISYFNYINRVADALGVSPETVNHPWESFLPTQKG